MPWFLARCSCLMWTLPAALSLQRLTGARRSSAPSLRSRGYRSLLQLHVVFTVTLPPRWGKGHSGTSLDIPPSGYSLSLMDVLRQYLGLYLVPFVLTEDPCFIPSSVDTLSSLSLQLRRPAPVATYVGLPFSFRPHSQCDGSVSTSSGCILRVMLFRCGAVLMHCSVNSCCHLGPTDG